MTSSRARSVATLLRHELRMLVRDRRAVVFSILLPLAFMPFILFSGLVVERQRERKLAATTFSYAVVGSEAKLARGLLAEGLAARSSLDEDEGRGELEMVERELEDPASALENDELHFYLEGLTAEENAARETEGAEVTAEAVVPAVRLYFRGDRDGSRSGSEKVRRLLDEARRRRRHDLLMARGFPLPFEDVVPAETRDVASSAQLAGATLGKFLTGLVLMFVLLGGSLAATDSIAGEKERGTLETLLTTAVSRGDIVTAKQLAVLVVALVVTLIQSLNLLVYIGFGLIPLPESFAVEVSLADVTLVFVILLPTVALVSSVLLMASGRAGTYKEAQLYFLPIFLGGLLLSSASLLPGIGLRSAIVLLPIANTSIAVREVLVGTYDWPFLMLGWLVSAGTAVWASRLTLRSLSTERLIMPSLGEGRPASGPEAFQREVVLWLGLIWVILFVVAANVEFLASVRRQVAFNVVVLFGGCSLLMLRRYRLDPRQALALRLPRPAVWVAVLLGAPAGNVVALGVFRLANLVLPVPEKWLEALGRSLVPTELPLWQLLVFLALLPGIFEEVLFRGMLLHGLRRRFRPLALCLVVGGAFGFFHVSLYRIIPTAWLGLVLSALTLLTGSIFPAMAWHALNNAAALLAGRAGFPLANLEPTTYLSAAVVLAGAFWIVYRCRTPYPGLRTAKRRE